jgi:hypothetical protein
MQPNIYADLTFRLSLKLMVHLTRQKQETVYDQSYIEIHMILNPLTISASTRYSTRNDSNRACLTCAP